MRLSKRLAFITGGSRGIGSAIATAFASEGADVTVVARTASDVAEVAKRISTEYSVSCFGAVCDVADVSSVERALVSVFEHFGKAPEILVNNAGIAESAPFARTSDELWNRIIGINLTGTFNCTRAVLPSMLAEKWGRIINISSVAGKVGAAYIGAYAASKHGVLGLTRSLAIEVARKSITVNAICPGYVDTDMAHYAVDNIVSKTELTADEALESLKKTSAQHRLISVEEVAALAVLLASEDGRGINGQAINLDGGSASS